MAEITSPTSNGTELCSDGTVLVTLTTVSTSDTWVCPYFQEIGAVIANNQSDNDGVGIGVSGQTITIKPTTAGDVINLQVEGRG